MRFHVIWCTYGSWLPGDPRGFRTRNHRMHVEGDYKNPPPAGMYDGLYRHARRSLKKPPVVISPALRELIGRACLERFKIEKVVAWSLSVGGEHVHAAFEVDSGDVKPMIGRVKKVSSHRIRGDLPGHVWAGGGGKIVRIHNEKHWGNVLVYIRAHEREGAWVWMREERDRPL